MGVSDSGVESADENVLDFLDSMDRYLVLVDSLSSILRQGWFDLASARHSMGSSRVSSALFDLKIHNASTTLQVQQADPGKVSPRFELCKWVSSENLHKSSEGKKFKKNELLQQEDSLQSDHKEPKDNISEDDGSVINDNNQAQKERLKSLSMFGALVAPKLRSSQLSFEKALETLVEIANTRASLLQAYDQVQENMKKTG